MRVMLVEDQREVAESTKVLLRCLGHEVQVAMNGMEARQLAETFVPDVALIDMGLPDCCGTEVGAYFRTLPRWDSVFLIALTGYNYEEECYRLGFDFFQNKPMDFRQLPEIVAKGRRVSTPSGAQANA